MGEGYLGSKLGEIREGTRVAVPTITILHGYAVGSSVMENRYACPNPLRLGEYTRVPNLSSILMLLRCCGQLPAAVDQVTRLQMS